MLWAFDDECSGSFDIVSTYFALMSRYGTNILSDSFSYIAVAFYLLSITKSSLNGVCFQNTQREYCSY